ncbi:Protein Y87G2A.2 [Aphelenchoides avenae]|nr:Protein Y87G2A.2 [Aphelenchus avenae]
MKHNWLRLDKIKEDSFRGECDSEQPNLRTFGGQVLAQALMAAYQTVPDGFLVNSLHCYFVRGGEEKTPIIYEVKRIRNGRNFAIRTVEAIQYGTVIHSSEFSFQKEANVPHLKVTPQFPQVPSPESLPTTQENKAHYLRANGGDPKVIRGLNTDRIAPSVELRPCDGDLYMLGAAGDDAKPLKQYVWVKYNDKVEADDFRLAHSTVAYLSDLTLVNTAMLPFPPQRFKLTTSLDHSAWFHEFRFDANEWLLYEQECVAHADNRSLVHGRIWTRSGRLLASTSQEVLVYTRKAKEETALRSKL